MNRGSSLPGWSNWTIPVRFNEAPIHESGKFQRLKQCFPDLHMLQ